LLPLPIASTPQLKVTPRSGHQHPAAFAPEILGDDRLEAQALGDRIEAVQVAQQEAEMVGAAQDRIGQSLLVGVQRAGRHLVQGRLPDVEAGAVDQQHPFLAGLWAQLASQPRRQFQPAGPAADDHDVVVHARHPEIPQMVNI
jgi:hypothetical protein